MRFRVMSFGFRVLVNIKSYLNSDELRFGGHGRIDESIHTNLSKGKRFFILFEVYNTNRTALVLKELTNIYIAK